MTNLMDHVLAAVLVIGLPLYAKLVWYPQLKRALAAGQPGARSRAYSVGIAVQWLLAGAALFGWLYAGRSLVDLGIDRPNGWGFWIGVGVGLVAVLGLSWQQRLVARSEEVQRQARDQVRALEALLPHSRSELTRFGLLSITTGICEELLFRGFLIWYLALFSGISGALLLSSVLFGLAHAYLGPRTMLGAGAAGLVLGGLYLLTGSLWVPMLLHAVVNINSGLIAYIVLRPSEPATATG